MTLLEVREKKVLKQEDDLYVEIEEDPGPSAVDVYTDFANVLK